MLDFSFVAGLVQKYYHSIIDRLIILITMESILYHYGNQFWYQLQGSHLSLISHFFHWDKQYNLISNKSTLTLATHQNTLLTMQLAIIYVMRKVADFSLVRWDESSR